MLVTHERTVKVAWARAFAAPVAPGLSRLLFCTCHLVLFRGLELRQVLEGDRCCGGGDFGACSFPISNRGILVLGIVNGVVPRSALSFLVLVLLERFFD